MKLLAPLLITLLIYTNLQAQSPYIGVSLSNRGAGFHAGILCEGIEVAASYKTPVLSAVKPSILSLSFGKQFWLTDKDEDNYSVTTSIGFANVRYKDLSEYNRSDAGEIKDVSLYKPIYNLEISKDAYLGRLFVSATYCKEFYASFGMKVFLNTER